MILVDTNVWSEAFRPRPNPKVLDWSVRNAQNLWLSTVVIGELLSGAHILPEGQRRRNFLQGYDILVGQYLDRIAVFDLAAARIYGPILAALEKAGRNPDTADAQIAATAKARHMALATRNVTHFEGLGVLLIDPWNE